MFGKLQSFTNPMFPFRTLNPSYHVDWTWGFQVHIIIWGMCQTFPSQTIEFWNAWCTHSTTFYHNSAQRIIILEPIIPKADLKWGVTEYFQDQLVKLANRKRTIDDLNLWWCVTEEMFFVFVFHLCQNTRDQPSRRKETNNHAFHI